VAGRDRRLRDDQPQVIEFKATTMESIGAAPAAQLRTVGIDLRENWPTALRDNGFDPGVPTAWSAEGLLVYLPPEAQDKLFDDIARRAAGSRPSTTPTRQRLSARGPGRSAHSSATEAASSTSRPQVFAGYGREFPETETLAPMRDSLAIVATRQQEQ
jgi:methyltransferase (TIGR00027 family)